MIFTRNETNVCSTIKKYLEDITSDVYCSKRCKVVHMILLYEYLLSTNVKRILPRPKFAKFCMSAMKKCDELRMEADDIKRHLGAWGLGLETYNIYNKLIEKLFEMKMFLKDNGVYYHPSPLPGYHNLVPTATAILTDLHAPAAAAPSKSPMEKESNPVLLRRSARLIAKHA